VLRCRFNGTLTVEDIEAFASGIMDGSIKPDLKSDDVPEDDKDGHVQIVVGHTVEDIVFDSTKDVLLEVYAPWCGHCQALEPAYKKLAARFKDIDSVVIAKMDGTTNEHPDIDVEGFPSIIFMPASEDSESASHRCPHPVSQPVRMVAADWSRTVCTPCPVLLSPYDVWLWFRPRVITDLRHIRSEH